MEVSIKLVDGGVALSMQVKRILLKGETLDSGQIQSVCSEIGKRYGIPSVPFSTSNKQEILIPATCTLPNSATFTVNDWLITTSGPSEIMTLNYRSNNSKQLLADLYKRALLIQAKQHFWTLDSPRILYERAAFKKIDGIVVIRRFEVSEVLLEQGLGFSVGLTTSFFSKEPIIYFFENGLQKEFDQLTNRQGEQQGTMLYKGPNGNSKCYFVKYGYDKKLIETDQFKENGIEYANSYDYYKRKFPKFEVSPDDKVVLVSFPNRPKQVYVPAKYLFPRIFNSSLEGELLNIDKIGTNEKRNYIQQNFWNKLGENPFGKGFSKTEKKYFTPPEDKYGIIPMPTIIGGQNKIVPAPEDLVSKSYKKHYLNRKLFLDKYGCYFIPPTLSGSKIYFIFPQTIPAHVQKRFVTDTVNYLKKLTRNEIEFDVIILPPYDNYLQATVSLKGDHDHGMVVFIFDHSNPSTYSLIDFELSGWPLKRATSFELLKKYKNLDRYQNAIKTDDRYEKAKNDWDSYIEMNTLGILQKLNCIPYIVQPEYFNYDMQIVIDVSEDFSHFCLSALLFRPGMVTPLLPCHTERKTDQKQETINPQILKDEIIKLFTSQKKVIAKHLAKRFLFARDGKDCGEEFRAIKEAFEELKSLEIVSKEAVFDFVEYHKTTRKEVRMWDVTPEGEAVNVLEGTFFMYRTNMAVLCTTGDGTLSSRVTADPITIVNKYTNADIYKVLQDFFYGAQFNFSSPRVAQKHTIPMKRADDELAEKRAQEIKRLK